MHAHESPLGSPPRPSAEAARRRVLEQHVELRRLLQAGLEHLRGTSVSHPSPSALRELVYLVRELFVQHLSDEEALVEPILEDDLPLGPRRMEVLRAEHVRQREELDALCAWPPGDTSGVLARRFGQLAAALLEDIDHEEHDLLTADVIRDDAVVIDQSDG
jgi:hypothetical protein